MSTSGSPLRTSGATTSALAPWGRAEKAKSTSSSSLLTLRSSGQRWGKTSASGLPAALRPLTEVTFASGCM